MLFLKRLRAAFSECKAGWKYAHADDELASRWVWHHEMFLIRVNIETAEEFLGGRSLWEMRFGYLSRVLKNRSTTGGLKPLPEDMDEIVKAWYEKDLYGTILAKQPGVFADVRLDAVQWFQSALNLTIDCGGLSSWQERDRLDRMLFWSGCTRDDFDWRED